MRDFVKVPYLCYTGAMDFRELANLGLSEKEAKVYLAALELGKCPVQKIAQKAGVNRATTYVIIEGLMRKGLMSSYTEGKKQFFFAEAPEKLKILFKDQELELKRKEEFLERLLPGLKKINAKKEERPVVRYFEGKEGLASMSEELSSFKEEPARMLYNQDLLLDVFQKDELGRFKQKRIKKDIKTRVLYNYKEKTIESTKDGERRKISEIEYPITCDVAIYGKNKVRIATLKNKIQGLIIENKEIHDTLKSLFDLAWDSFSFKDKNKTGRK